MAAAETTSGYIEHHLQNLQVCSTDQGLVWNIQEGIASDVCKGNFWALNVDTLGMSLLLGFFFIWIFRKVAKSATTGVPGKLQCFIEMIVEFVDDAIVKRQDAVAAKHGFKLTSHSMELYGIPTVCMDGACGYV